MEVNLVFKRCLSVFLFFLSIWSLSGQETEYFVKNIKNIPLLITTGGADVDFFIQIEANDEKVEMYQGNVIVSENFQLKEKTSLSYKEKGILKMTIDVTKEPFYLFVEDKYLLFEKNTNGKAVVFDAKTEEIRKILKISPTDVYKVSPDFDEEGILRKIHTELISDEYHHHSFDIHYIREPSGIRISLIKGYFFDPKTARKANIKLLFSVFEP